MGSDTYFTELMKLAGGNSTTEFTAIKFNGTLAVDSTPTVSSESGQGIAVINNQFTYNSTGTVVTDLYSSDGTIQGITTDVTFLEVPGTFTVQYIVRFEKYNP